jgi:hypothetical protein
LIPRKPLSFILPAPETDAIPGRDTVHVVILAEFAAASGGAEKVALESARGLAEAGLAVTYIQAISGAVDPLLDHAGIQRIDLGLPDIWSLGAARAAAAAAQCAFVQQRPEAGRPRARGGRGRQEGGAHPPQGG